MELNELQARLEGVFAEELPGCRVMLDSSATRLGGVVLWDGFSDLDQGERQHHIREIIRRHFDHEDQLKISLVVTFTPHEYEIIKAESA